MKFKLAFDDSLTKVFSAAIDLCQISSNSVDDQKNLFSSHNKGQPCMGYMAVNTMHLSLEYLSTF